MFTFALQMTCNDRLWGKNKQTWGLSSKPTMNDYANKYVLFVEGKPLKAEVDVFV